MSDLHVILWSMGGAFAINFGILGIIWNSLNKKIDGNDQRLTKQIDDMDHRLNTKIDANDQKLTKQIDDLDQRLTKQIDDLDQRLNTKIDAIDQRLTKRIDELDQKFTKRMDELDHRLSHKIDKLDEKVTDVDRRLCRLEGAFASKDCCMIKDDRRLPKADSA